MTKPAKDSRAKQIIERLTATKSTIATAESCTGGMVAAALTGVPGSSAAYFGSYITYSNLAKTRMIRVPGRLIHDYGAVSNQVARAMADGARNTARVDFAVSVTGVAGPDGGTDRKPVGLVYAAVSSELATVVIEHRFDPALSRDEIRRLSVDAALELVWQVLTSDEDD